MTVEVLYDGVDFVDDALLGSCRFSAAANGNAGTTIVRIRDFDHGHSFVVGQPLQWRIDGQMAWDGYVTEVRRGYFMIDAKDPDTRIRFFELHGVDRNILFLKRFLYDKVTPTKVTLTEYPAGTADDVIVKAYMASHLDLGGDGLTDTLVEHVGTPSTDSRISGAAGWSWRDLMEFLRRETGAVYYIDPDRNLVLTDVDSPDAPYGISDVPGAGEVGCSDLEIDYDAGKMINDSMMWGAGQGSAEPVFSRIQHAGSIASHGRWQHGGANMSVFRQSSINRISASYVYGSPQSRRGGAYDAVSVRCVVWQSGFRVGQKVNVRSMVWDEFEDVLPIRAMEVDFPAGHPRYRLSLSHEIDQPWSTYEWWMPAMPGFPTMPGVPHIAIPGVDFGGWPPLLDPGWPPIGEPFNPCAKAPIPCLEDAFIGTTAAGAGWGTADTGEVWGIQSAGNGTQNVISNGVARLMQIAASSGTTSGTSSAIVDQCPSESGDILAQFTLSGTGSAWDSTNEWNEFVSDPNPAFGFAPGTTTDGTAGTGDPASGVKRSTLSVSVGGDAHLFNSGGRWYISGSYAPGSPYQIPPVDIGAAITPGEWFAVRVAVRNGVRYARAWRYPFNTDPVLSEPDTWQIETAGAWTWSTSTVIGHGFHSNFASWSAHALFCVKVKVTGSAGVGGTMELPGYYDDGSGGGSLETTEDFDYTTASGWGTSSMNGWVWEGTDNPQNIVTGGEGRLSLGGFQELVMTAVEWSLPINILMKARFTDGIGKFTLQLYADGNSNSVVFDVDAGQDLTAYVDGTAIMATGWTGHDFSGGEDFWLRMELTASGIAMTMWADGAAEPSQQATSSGSPGGIVTTIDRLLLQSNGGSVYLDSLQIVSGIGSGGCEDDFERDHVAGTGWGTGDIGTWIMDPSDPDDVYISGGMGIVDLNFDGVGFVNVYVPFGAPITPPVEVLTRGVFRWTADSDNWEVGVILDSAGGPSGSSEWCYFFLDVTAGGAGFPRTYTLQGALDGTPAADSGAVSGITASVSADGVVTELDLWIRVRAEPTGIFAKVWENGTTEPSGWTFEAVNATYPFTLPLESVGFQVSGDWDFDSEDFSLKVHSVEITEGCTGGGGWTDPCTGETVGLADPPDDGEVCENLTRVLVDTDGTHLRATSQFTPRSTKVWADGKILRRGTDYQEHALLAKIVVFPHVDLGGWSAAEPSRPVYMCYHADVIEPLTAPEPI